MVVVVEEQHFIYRGYAFMQLSLLIISTIELYNYVYIIMT